VPGDFEAAGSAHGPPDTKRAQNSNENWAKTAGKAGGGGLYSTERGSFAGTSLVSCLRR
jgi:hypothetical protein